MDILKAAIVGCGGAGMLHARGYVEAPGSRLVAAYDRHADRAQRLAAECNAVPYASLEELLQQARPDVVSVTTGEYEHMEPTIMALEAGAHVLCEKMMAHSLEAGQIMVAAARRTGRVLGVNYNYRHVPAYMRIRDHVAANTLGAPVLLVAQAHSYTWHHMLDLVRFFFGHPVAVEATLIDDPTSRLPPWHDRDELLYQPSTVATATLRFATGALAVVTATAHVPFADHWMSFSIYGRQAEVSLNHICRDNLIGTLGPSPLAGELRKLPMFTWQDSMVQSVSAFVSTLCDGHPPASTGEDGLAMMRLEHAVAQSARETRALQV